MINIAVFFDLNGFNFVFLSKISSEFFIDLLLPKITFDQILTAIRSYSSQEQKVICAVMEKKGVKPVKDTQIQRDRSFS